MTDDPELLRQFAEENSDAAFRELVLRRIDFVYTAALRQVGGDAHLAQDVVQGVFLDLARKARRLVQRPNLAGWLYTSTRFAAAKVLRARSRRERHETEAQIMNETLSANSAAEINWAELQPVLDEAMHELNERDREAILLRFFENRPLAGVATALGLAENSARMRVDRALGKLRHRLARRGITSTAAALAGGLAAQPLIAAPAGMAAAVASVSLAGAAVGGGIGTGVLLGTLKLMSVTKITAGALGMAAALGLGVYLGAHYQTSGEPAAADRRTAASVSVSAMDALREENSRLKAELVQLRLPAPAGAARNATASASTRSAAALEQLRVLTELQRRKLANAEISFVGDVAKQTPAFTELFALVPAEQEILQRTVNRARDRLADFER